MKIIDELGQKGFIEHKVLGGSMMPFIRSGDRVIIVNKIRRLKKGEIGLFLLEENLVLHRVKKVKNNGYIFYGDNRYRSDGFVSEEKVFGRLIALYKPNKKIECETKSFMVKGRLFNFWLFKPFLVFSMRTISRIKKLFKK